MAYPPRHLAEHQQITDALSPDSDQYVAGGLPHPMTKENITTTLSISRWTHGYMEQLIE